MSGNDSQVDDEQLSENIDRRTLLRGTTGVTILGVATSLAGCNDQSDTGDGEDGDGTSGDGTSGDGTDDETTPEDQVDRQRVEPISYKTWTESANPTMFEAARVVMSELEKLGLEVEFDTMRFPQPMLDVLFETRDFDIQYQNFTDNPDRYDPSFYLHQFLHSQNAPPSGEDGSSGWNVSGYDNPEYDELADQQQEQLDPGERQETVYEMQEIIREDEPVPMVLHPENAIALNTDRWQEPSELVPGGGISTVWVHSILEPARSDIDTFAVASKKDSLGPIHPVLTQESTNVFVMNDIYDALLRFGPKGEPEPWIAEEFTVESDTTITVTLLDGLTFHDGEPVTAEDVKFSYEYLRDNKAASYFSILEPLDSAETSGRDVTFTLAEPTAPFITQGLGRVPIIPKHIWEDIDDPRNYENDELIGSGPFKFERRQRGQFWEFTTWESHPRAPSYDKLRWDLYSNSSAMVQAISRGETDARDRLETAMWDQVQTSQSTTLIFQSSNARDFLIINTRRGMPYSDPAFRRAVSHAVPRERILNQLYDGQGDVGGSMTAPGNEFWHNPDVEPREFDIETARTILEDAGYAWDDDGRLMYPVE